MALFTNGKDLGNALNTNKIDLDIDLDIQKLRFWMCFCFHLCCPLQCPNSGQCGQKTFPAKREADAVVS